MLRCARQRISCLKFAHGRESVSAQCLHHVCGRHRDAEAKWFESFALHEIRFTSDDVQCLNTNWKNCWADSRRIP